MKDPEKTRTTELEEFRAELDRRLAPPSDDESVDGEEFFQQLRRKLRERDLKRA